MQGFWFNCGVGVLGRDGESCGWLARFSCQVLPAVVKEGRLVGQRFPASPPSSSELLVEETTLFVGKAS